MQVVNPAVERLFGYATDELLGRNISVLIPSPDRERHNDYLARYPTAGEKRITGAGREVVAQRKDGSTFPVSLAVSEMKLDGERTFTGINETSWDRPWTGHCQTDGRATWRIEAIESMPGAGTTVVINLPLPVAGLGAALALV